MDILQTLYRECRAKPIQKRSIEQGLVLTAAAALLGQPNPPGHLVRNAIVLLCMKFNLQADATA